MNPRVRCISILSVSIVAHLDKLLLLQNVVGLCDTAIRIEFKRKDYAAHCCRVRSTSWVGLLEVDVVDGTDVCGVYLGLLDRRHPLQTTSLEVGQPLSTLLPCRMTEFALGYVPVFKFNEPAIHLC